MTMTRPTPGRAADTPLLIAVCRLSAMAIGRHSSAIA